MASSSPLSSSPDKPQTENVYYMHECGEHCEFGRQTIAGLQMEVEKLTRDHEQAKKDENTRNKAVIDYLISSKTSESKLRDAIVQLQEQISSIEKKLVAKDGNEAQSGYVTMSRIARAALTQQSQEPQDSLDNRSNSHADTRSYSSGDGLSPSLVDNFNPDETEAAYRARHSL